MPELPIMCDRCGLGSTITLESYSEFSWSPPMLMRRDCPVLAEKLAGREKIDASELVCEHLNEAIALEFAQWKLRRRL